MTPGYALAVARAAAGELMPYLRSALLALVPVEALGLGTVAVSKTMVLLWDPEALLRWSRDEAACSLIHEVWHVLRGHFDRGAALAADGTLWNVAADMEINDDLREAAPFKAVVGRWILPEPFGFSAGDLAEGYYRQLQQANAARGIEAFEVPGAGRGWCGSCAGRAVPGEPEPGESNKPGSDGDGGSESSKPRDGSDGGGVTPSPVGRSGAEVQGIRRRVATALCEAGRSGSGRGSIPGGWLRWAETTLRPPVIRWQDKLARAVRSAIAYRSGAVDWTYRKVSRRQAGVGYGPGRPILHATHTPVPEVDAWVDTSGSMEEDELSAALREVRGLLQAATVRFGTVDAAVQAAPRIVRDWRVIPSLLRGGGGTDFQAAFEESSRAARRGDTERVVIFFTDGNAAVPEAPPPRVRTIWVLIGPNRVRPCAWGSAVEVC